MNSQALFCGYAPDVDILYDVSVSGADQIGYRIPLISVSSNSSPLGITNPFFRWWDSSGIDGNVLFETYSSGYPGTEGIDTTTTFYIDELLPGCMSSGTRQAITITVGDYDHITISGSDGTENTGVLFTLTADQLTFDNIYTQFVWTVDVETGSGLTNPTDSSPNNFKGILATIPGTYVYTCIAYDPDKDVYAKATITVTVS